LDEKTRMLNLIKSPHELLMEQAGLPSFAEGHSVSPEQMRVELMINGHKVHQEDLPHDHPLIQHLAGGGQPATMWEKVKAHLPAALGHTFMFGLPALDVINQMREHNYGNAAESGLDAAIGLMPLPVQAAVYAMHGTELNPNENEELAARNQLPPYISK